MVLQSLLLQPPTPPISPSRRGPSPPLRHHPVSLCLLSLRSSLSLSSPSAAAGYPRQARTVLPAAGLLPSSSSGLRTRAAPAALTPRRSRPLRLVSASSEPFFGLPPRATPSYLLLLASQSAKCREFLTGPLLLRCGVPPSLLPRALIYVDALLFFVMIVCGVLDLLDILREHVESKEHYRKTMEKYNAVLRAVLQRLREGDGEEPATAESEIQR